MCWEGVRGVETDVGVETYFWWIEGDNGVEDGMERLADLVR